MANINFQNTGLAVNPGLEEVLDPNGTVTSASASIYAITRASGPFAGFQFLLTSSGSTFTYAAGVPTAGTIDGIIVLSPVGATVVSVVAGAGGFDDQNLVHFYNTLHGPSASLPALAALFDLLNKPNVVTGSAIADHATAFGFAHNDVFGNNGNDLISSREFDSTLVGNAGNDTFLLRGSATFSLVAGANQNGTGGAGETNTVEVRGSSPFDNNSNIEFSTITNINALRFVDDHVPAFPVVEGAADLEVDLRTDQIRAGQISPTLAVNGSTTASPRSQNEIDIFHNDDLADRTPVNLNLSGWTFTNWNQNQNRIDINTNQLVALNDHVIGTKVADDIETYAGDDTIQGGGGADGLNGEDGNDTFVYGLNEAAKGEFVSGGDDSTLGGTADKVLVLANNDFTGVFFSEIEQFVFGAVATATFDQFTFDSPPPKIIGNGNVNALVFQLTNEFHDDVPAIDLSALVFQSWTNGTDKITIRGTARHDSIAGSSQNDVIDGKGGSDFLEGNGGNDAFLFDTAFGHGVPNVADFTRGQDILEFDDAIFTTLKLGVLAKKELGFGTHATSHKQHIIFDEDTGAVRYDDDGSGKHKAHIVAILDDVSALKHGDILVI